MKIRKVTVPGSSAKDSVEISENGTVLALCKTYSDGRLTIRALGKSVSVTPDKGHGVQVIRIAAVASEPEPEGDAPSQEWQ